MFPLRGTWQPPPLGGEMSHWRGAGGIRESFRRGAAGRTVPPARGEPV